MSSLFALLFGALGLIGIAYTLLAAWVVARLPTDAPPWGAAEPVTLLKPLHGGEPRLAENLATFLDQDWPAPIQMIAGVQRVDDPAIAIVKDLDGAVVDLVVDPRSHGPNAKISNLLNMAPLATADLLVLSDSDMAVPRNYLRRIATMLAAPGVGAVSCLYRGRGDAGGWSRLAAAQISYQFLPSVLVGLHLGLAKPCMGSTIALRRRTLDQIGGFARFAGELADDYAIGAAIRAEGLAVAVPTMILTHACVETRFVDVWRHELRWAATVKGIDPAGYAGSLVTYPVALSLLTALFSPATGALLLVGSVFARHLLQRRIDAVTQAQTAPLWLLPVRDVVSFAVFLVAFFVRSVDWRGARLKMTSEGRLAVQPSMGPPAQAE